MDLAKPMAAGLVHVGYVVRNMDASIRRFANDGYKLEVEPTDDPIQRVTCAQLTDGVTSVELVSPLGEDSPVQTRLKRGGGLDHLCFAVPDVETAMQAEVERGAIVACEPVRAVTFNRTIGFVFRKTGLIIEYMSTEALPEESSE